MRVKRNVQGQHSKADVSHSTTTHHDVLERKALHRNEVPDELCEQVPSSPKIGRQEAQYAPVGLQLSGVSRRTYDGVDYHI